MKPFNCQTVFFINHYHAQIRRPIRLCVKIHLAVLSVKRSFSSTNIGEATSQNAIPVAGLFAHPVTAKLIASSITIKFVHPMLYGIFYLDCFS